MGIQWVTKEKGKWPCKAVRLMEYVSYDLCVFVLDAEGTLLAESLHGQK